jgi:mitochondrial translocator assembly and maintenance protein 41
MFIVTDDPEAWHRENLTRNAAHYSTLLRCWCTAAGGGDAPRALARLQRGSGARILFNTLVPFEDGLIKYGVIATRDLISDLVGERSFKALSFQLPLL